MGRSWLTQGPIGLCGEGLCGESSVPVGCRGRWEGEVRTLKGVNKFQFLDKSWKGNGSRAQSIVSRDSGP